MRNDNIIWTNKKQSTKGLKKTGKNEWYDGTTNTYYTKVRGKLQSYEDATDKKYYQQLLRHLNYYNKGGVLDSYKNDLKSAHKELLKEIKRFNKGEAKTNIRLMNASKYFKETYDDIRKLTSTSNLKETVKTRNLVKALRIHGFHGINENDVQSTLENILTTFSDSLGLSNNEIQDLLLPKGYEEASKYEELADILIEHEPSLLDIIEEKRQDGTIDDITATRLRSIARGTIEALFENMR